MEINPKNINAVLDGTEKALEMVKKREEAYQKVLQALSRKDITLEILAAAFYPLAESQLFATIAEVNALKVQVEQLKFIKQRMESNIVVPEMATPEQNGGGPKIIL